MLDALKMFIEDVFFAVLFLLLIHSGLVGSTFLIVIVELDVFIKIG